MPNRRNNRGLDRVYAIALSAAMLVCSLAGLVQAQEFSRASALPSLSGIVWVEDDLFIGVHDAKRNKNYDNVPRVSLIRLPGSKLKEVTWQPLDLKFPGPEGQSSDLESVSRIPGVKAFLFAESGQEDKGSPRIFLAMYSNGTLKIESYVYWPVPVKNVEAIAVCRVGDQLVFMYAERAAGLASTKLRWATIALNPFRFGEFREITYAGVDPVGKGARPIASMDIDSQGFIYIASAYDPRSDGPFRSVIWRIGKITADTDGSPQVKLGETRRLATLDGLKVEGVAVRELHKGGKLIYVGTDDEHYGGIIRLLPGTH
jgi:hypothetical protein